MKSKKQNKGPWIIDDKMRLPVDETEAMIIDNYINPRTHRIKVKNIMANKEKLHAGNNTVAVIRVKSWKNASTEADSIKNAACEVSGT